MSRISPVPDRPEPLAGASLCEDSAMQHVAKLSPFFKATALYLAEGTTCIWPDNCFFTKHNCSTWKNSVSAPFPHQILDRPKTIWKLQSLGSREIANCGMRFASHNDVYWQVSVPRKQVTKMEEVWRHAQVQMKVQTVFWTRHII